MNDSQRGFLIIAVVALLAVVSTTVSKSVDILGLLLNIAFLAALTYALYNWFNSRQGTIATMDAKWRALLYVSAVGLYIVGVTGLIFPGWAGQVGAVGAIAFFALLGACGYGWYYAWQQRSSRW